MGSGVDPHVGHAWTLLTTCPHRCLLYWITVEWCFFFFSFSFAAAFASSSSWEPYKFRFSREILQVTYSSLRLMGNFYRTSSTFFCLSTKACEIVISKIYFVRPPQKNSCFQITTKKHYKHYWSAWHAKQTNKNFPFWLYNNVPYKISL